MHLTLHLTKSCNMNCQYCYSPPSIGPSMTFDIGRKALELGAKMSNGSCGIIFFGGEPLLHKTLIKRLVKYGRELEYHQKGRFHFKITTNGILLDHKFIKFSIENDILIAMSFDGIREAHDKYRMYHDGTSTFDLLVKRLDLLIKTRPYSSILMVVNPETANYLTKSVTFLREMSCKYIIISLNYAAEWTEFDLKILKDQFKRLANLYIEWTRKGEKFYLSPFEVKISSHINKHIFRKERCELAKNQISIDQEGNLYPCVQFVTAGSNSFWRIGNVFHGIDEKKRGQINYLSQKEKSFCEKCAIKNRCNNTCGCLNWQTTGTINNVSPVLCRYEQMLVPIADKIGKLLYRKKDPYFLHKHYNSAYPVISLIEESLINNKRLNSV